MEKHENGIACTIFIGESASGKTISRTGGPGEAAIIGCFDRVYVEHIRNGKVIYSDEEK